MFFAKILNKNDDDYFNVMDIISAPWSAVDETFFMIIENQQKLWFCVPGQN